MSGPSDEWPVNAGPGELSPDRLLPGERLLWSARPGRVRIPWRRVVRSATSLLLDAAVFGLVLAYVTAAPQAKLGSESVSTMAPVRRKAPCE